MKFKIFRWKAIGPLLLFLSILVLLIWIFAEPVARQTTEEASSQLLGTQVDVGKLDLIPSQASVELRALQVANPFVLTHNLLEADDVRLKLNPAALAQKKLVIENLTLHGLRFGTARKQPARPPTGKGFAPQVYRSVQQWAKQFDAPLMSLTPIDTIRQLALDPTQLTTIREAQALLTRVDSTRKILEQTFKQLDIRPTLDSARSLAEQLSAADPKKLGLEGTRQAIQTVQATLKQLDVAKKRLAALEQNTRASVQSLGEGVQLLDQARQKDYAFAKSLLKLPSFSAPDIGSAFFGKVSLERFKQALYWAELAQQYMPPGLLPHPTPGPRRLRAAGETIEFPKQKEFPRFLLERGQLDFAIGGTSPIQGAYTATVAGLTSTPALYGQPAVITASRKATGTSIGSIDVGAIINHITSRTHDSADARLRDVRLPAFDLPGLPLRVDPGAGATNLTFIMKNAGADLLGRWSIGSKKVSWIADTAGRQLNDLERVVLRAISGLNDLQVVAELGGSLAKPRFSVSSNLDQAVASRIQAVMGEEIAKAEKMVRAKVDSLVGDKVEPVKKQISSVQSEATGRVQTEKQQLNGVEKRLKAELKRLTGGLAPGIQLPKIKL